MMSETETDDLSWHPAFTAAEKADIREGRARAFLYLGALIFERLDEKPIADPLP